MSKSIIRTDKKSNYVVLDKSFLKDKRLSWKAKGLLSYMLSLPDDWEFYLDELERHSTDGMSSLRSGFKELQDNGYVTRKRERKPDGKFRWTTIVHEVATCENPHVEKPHMEKPHMENRKLLNNNELSNNKLNNNESNYIVEIVNYLNDVAGKNYRHTTRKTQQLIKARMNEGFTVDDFKKVIDKKSKDWKHDKKMNRYLRPETLFGTKFEGYLNENVVPENKTKDEQIKHVDSDAFMEYMRGG